MARKARNEVAVGVTVLVVLGLVAYIIVMLADWSSLFVPKQEIIVKVHYKVGLKGLQIGSPIQLGGVKIGYITRTEIRSLDQNVADSNQIYAFFTMKIPQQYQLRTDCVLAPRRNLLGGQSLLDIEDLGIKGEIIKGESAVELTLANDTMYMIRREFNTDDPRSLLARVKRDIPVVTSAIQRTLEKLDSVLNIAVAALQEFSPKDPNSLMARTKKDVLAITGRMQVTLAKADSTLESAKTALGEFDPCDPNSLLACAKNDILAITSQLRRSTIKADSALDHAQGALRRLREYTSDERVDRIIDNVGEVTANFKLTSQSIRRAPWKLFYRPKEKESEMQALLDSSAAFVVGAERLDSAALRLQRLIGTADDQTPIDNERIKSVLSELETSFEAFREAEQRFWQNLP